MVREALKEKKPIADKTIDKSTPIEDVKKVPTDSDEDVKKRSKI